MKWVDLRPQIDHVQGTVTPSQRGWGFSPADRAALEVAIRLADAWDTEVVLVCAGPAAADRALTELASSGAQRIVRIDQSDRLNARVVAEVLAAVLGSGDLNARVVLCGDLSYDRGSGSVPALLAHHLQYAQALGLIEVSPAEKGHLEAIRRLDGARRERLEVSGPSVLSVEGSVATLRRASLAASLTGANGGALLSSEVRTGRIEPYGEPLRTRPWRPRARVLAAPQGAAAFDRIVALSAALVDQDSTRPIEAEPAAAAQLILRQLRDWGYLDPIAEGVDP